MSPKFPFIQYIRNSLRAKITLGVIFPLVFILGVFAALENNRQQEVILSQLTASASRSVRVIENSLRHSMLKSDFSEVQTVLDSINDTEDFRVVYLLNTKGEIIFAPNQIDVGDQLSNKDPGCITCHSLDPSSRPGSMIVTADDGDRVFRSMYPIRNSQECSECHDPKQEIIGLLLTDIPVAPVEQSLETGFRKSLIWWIGMIVVTALIINFSLDSLVLKRLKGLSRALQDFGKGNRTIRLENGSTDEIGLLGKSFNEMGQRIEIEETENQKLSDQLRNQNMQRGELLKRLINAQEDERKRVARELHDDIGQALSALSLQVQSLERLFETNSSDAVDQISKINDLIADTTERMYELILALRPSMLDEFGLVAAVRNHAEKSLQGSDIEFTVEASEFLGRLSPDLETTLYRIFQEAISNVRRHAEAKNLKISLQKRDGIFLGEISDDGRGFDVQTLELSGNNRRGLGVISIKERIAQHFGKVIIDSQPGKGTTIKILISDAEANYD